MNKKTQTMKAKSNNTATKSTRKNKQWLRNPDQLKNPKLFQVTMVRLPDKSFHIIGNQSKVFIKKNQHVGSWESVDTRDLTCELNHSKITSL